MTLDELMRDIHTLREDLLIFERKYGVLSNTFYQSYANGDEPDDDAWVLDWAAWAGTYEVYLQRFKEYEEAIEALKTQMPAVADIIKRTARHESIPVPA